MHLRKDAIAAFRPELSAEAEFRVWSWGLS